MNYKHTRKHPNVFEKKRLKSFLVNFLESPTLQVNFSNFKEPAKKSAESSTNSKKKGRKENEKKENCKRKMTKKKKNCRIKDFKIERFQRKNTLFIEKNQKNKKILKFRLISNNH